MGKNIIVEFVMECSNFEEFVLKISNLHIVAKLRIFLSESWHSIFSLENHEGGRRFETGFFISMVFVADVLMQIWCLMT